MKNISRPSRTFFLVALFFMMLPTLLGFYKGETGRLIVATSPNADRYFSASVVYIFDHSWEGGVGVVVNQKMKANDSAIPKYLAGKNLPIYKGGPVEFPDKVLVLEKVGEVSGEISLLVSPFEKMVADDPAALEKIEDSFRRGEDRYRIYLGYAGWGSSQMEMEFIGGAWLRTEFHTEWVFNAGESPLEIWKKALSKAERKGRGGLPGII
jgi:putative transcriptional regulator